MHMRILFPTRVWGSLFYWGIFSLFLTNIPNNLVEVQAFLSNPRPTSSLLPPISSSSTGSVRNLKTQAHAKEAIGYRFKPLFASLKDEIGNVQYDKFVTDWSSYATKVQTSPVIDWPLKETMILAGAAVIGAVISSAVLRRNKGTNESRSQSLYSRFSKEEEIERKKDQEKQRRYENRMASLDATASQMKNNAARSLVESNRRAAIAAAEEQRRNRFAPNTSLNQNNFDERRIDIEQRLSELSAVEAQKEEIARKRQAVEQKYAKMAAIEAQKQREYQEQRIAEEKRYADLAVEEARKIKEYEAKRLAEEQRFAESEAQKEREYEQRRMIEEQRFAAAQAQRTKEYEERLVAQKKQLVAEEKKRVEREKRKKEEDRRIAEDWVRSMEEQKRIDLEKKRIAEAERVAEEARIMREAEERRISEEREQKQLKIEQERLSRAAIEAQRKREAEEKRIAAFATVGSEKKEKPIGTGLFNFMPKPFNKVIEDPKELQFAEQRLLAAIESAEKQLIGEPNAQGGNGIFFSSLSDAGPKSTIGKKPLLGDDVRRRIDNIIVGLDKGSTSQKSKARFLKALLKDIDVMEKQLPGRNSRVSLGQRPAERSTGSGASKQYRSFLTELSPTDIGPSTRYPPPSNGMGERKSNLEERSSEELSPIIGSSGNGYRTWPTTLNE